jgi:hypothetical protein
MEAISVTANRVSASNRGPRQETSITMVAARNSAVNSIPRPECKSADGTVLEAAEQRHCGSHRCPGAVSVAGVLAAVDVKGFAGHERTAYELNVGKVLKSL